MQEITNKQCQICGEYVPVDAKTCPYCGENLDINQAIEQQNYQSASDNELIENNTQNNSDLEKCNKKFCIINRTLLKYSLITISVIILLIVIIFFIFYVVNLNTDVTIETHDNNKITESKILDTNLSENIKQAKILYKEGKLDEAAQLFQDEIDSNNDPVAYYYLGEIYKNNNFTKIAISNYKRALEYKKNFYEPLKRLAEIYTQKGENEVALDYANRALKQKSNDIEMLKTTAKIYRNLGNEEKLIQILQKIIEINPKEYDSNSYLAYYFYNQNKYKETIPYFQNMLNVVYDTNTAYGLAVCYAQIEYYSKAIEVLDLIIKNDPAEYYNAMQAKLKLSDMKNYYNSTHKKTPTPKVSKPQKTKQESYNNEAENALF